MGKFSKIKEYSKPSHKIDEKIQELNKELEKTGVLFEAPSNSTSGLYGGQDQEDTTQNTNTRIEDPDGGERSDGTPYVGTFGNYDASGTFTYITISGNGNYNIGELIRGFDRVNDDDGNWLGYYKIRITPSFGNSYLHIDRVWVERRGPFNLYWVVKGRRAGGTQEIDLFLGTTFWRDRPVSVSFWSNTTERPVPGEIRQKPSWYHFMTRGDRDKDSWDKVKDMLDAGKEWMDRMFGERIKGKLDKIKELLNPLSEKALRGLEDVLQFTEDKFGEFIGDSIKKSIGTGSAVLTLTTFFDHQEGKVNYTKDKPYTLPYDQGQKQNISNAFDNALNYIDNMGFDIRGKIDRGEKFTQQEIDFLNQKMNFEFGNTPEGFGFYRTFGKFSPNVQITKNSKGGYDITDNYVFTDLDDFDGGNIEIGNLKLGPGVKGKYYAEKDKGDVDFFDSDGPDKKRIGSLKQMYITTSLPTASPVKEELTLEDIERQLILEELEYDYLIRKLSRIDVEEKIVKEDKTIRRVSSAVNDPSPILEKKTIQTERKSPNRFLVKEKQEDTSRTKWMKRILRHVGAKDFRKTHQRCLDEQRELYLEERERLGQEIIIKELSEPYKSDWRSDLFEGMTTSGLLRTTLPATGDIEYSVTETDIVRDGGDVFVYFDTRVYDTLVVDAHVDDGIVIFLGTKPLATLVDPDDVLADIRASGTYSFRVPQSQNFFFNFLRGVSPGADPNGVASIINVRAKRTTPLNVFVSLDSPEASSFIRTDPIMRGFSANERRKKLEDMLDAGDEYLLKQVGLQGSTARPADTGVVQSFMDIQTGDQGITKTTYAPQKSSDSTSPSAEYQAARQETERAKARYDMLKSTASATPTDLSKAKQDYETASAREFAIMTGKQFVPPTPPKSIPATKTQLTPQQLSNIDNSLKQLEIDKQRDKDAAVKRNLEFAANLAMDAATVAALLSPIPGDESTILAARGGAQVAKQTAFDKAEAEVIKRTAKAAAEKAARRSAERTSNFNFDMNRLRSAMQSGIKPGRLYQSYEPQGQVISEKKLRSPKEIVNKIPGYYDGKPSPLGFPDNPPPEMVNGMHPDLVDGKKVADRFNRLDPESARSMPLTGNPHIDKKVMKARKQPK